MDHRPRLYLAAENGNILDPPAPQQRPEPGEEDDRQPAQVTTLPGSVQVDDLNGIPYF